MALLQISEPGMSAAPHQHRLAVGIDLGTTNSLVATIRSGKAETLADPKGEHLLPSVVRYLESGEKQVGFEALSKAQEDPLNTIASIKRLMGRGKEDIKPVMGQLPYEFDFDQEGVPRVKTVSGSVGAIEVSAEILKVLRQRAEASLGGELTGAVITVPAYFDDAQRQATKDAARLAGINVLRLLNEPTAAAVAYGLDKKSEGVFVIYDLGGGTFDVSILHLEKGVFQVLATAGDSALGGDDMDNAVAHWLLAVADSDTDLQRSESRRILLQARTAKEKLSTSNQTEVEINGNRIVLTREQLNTCIDSLIDKTLTPCRRALKDAGITVSDVTGVVLVGGSTRVIRVRERVEAFFGKAPLVDIDPDKVVAIGAALQADVLAGNKPDNEMLLLDVIPLSLGIEIMGGMVEKIIPRNSTIPIARAQEFTTFKDGQTAMSVHVVQGERELVDDCRSLARFELRGIPPMAAGAARIRVTYQVDADGLLSVAAQEQTSGVEASVEVKPSYGLTDNQIEGMLRDSMNHAEEDVALRALREQQVEADRVIEALNSALARDGSELLDEKERAEIDNALTRLTLARNGADHREIKLAIEAVDSASSGFAARRMDAGIRKALAGHKIEEFSPSDKES